LAERRLSLWEMTPEADWEGSRMSADPLPFDALQWRVSIALGKPDPHVFSQLLMRPDRGCVTLVSARSFLLHTSGCSWFLRPGFFSFLQEVGWHKPSLPRVPQDAVDRAARRVAAEEEKKKKDAEKARARERRRARDALEKLRRRQEREGLPREPSPETPDDDDDDEDDDEEDDMAACLGLSPDLGFGQEPSSQPPSWLTPSVPGVGASGSWPEGRGQPERAPDPSAGGAEVTPEGQVRASALREPLLAPAAQGGDPQVTVTVPGQSAPRASKARVVPKLPAKRTSAVVSGAGIQETSPGTVDHGPERVSISECLRLGFPFICSGHDFSFSLSKRSHGLTDLAPRKALKTTPACAASAAPGLAVQPTSRKAFHRRGLGQHRSPWSRFPRLALLPRRPS
jgi:hypothetical protein